MSRNPIITRNVTLLTLAMLAVMGPAAADARASELVVDASMLAGEVTERASGEIRIAVAEKYFDNQGEPYRLVLSFPDRGHFEAAVADPFEPIALAAFDNILVRQRSGEILEMQRAGGKRAMATQDFLGQAESAVCGSILLRAMVELPSGVLMGVNVHATPERIQPFRLGFDKNTIPGECAYDVFDDCDTWAIGGCGGPDCVITCHIGGFVFNIIGRCRENDIFGPNTCSCNP